MIGAKKLCKYDEIVKIPSENLHPIPGAQSQSGLESGPENPIRRPAAAHCTPSIRACTSYTLIFGAFPKKETELNFHMISLAPIGCRKLAIELVVDIIQSLDAEVSSSASGSELGNQDK